jgi:hypothetical protein
MFIVVDIYLRNLSIRQIPFLLFLLRTIASQKGQTILKFGILILLLENLITNKGYRFFAIGVMNTKSKSPINIKSGYKICPLNNFTTS